MSPDRYTQLVGRLDSLRSFLIANLRGDYLGWELSHPVVRDAVAGAINGLGLPSDYTAAELDEALDGVRAELLRELCSGWPEG